ncbi:MAG: zf-HC2 domain-containing protein [bacterium]
MPKPEVCREIVRQLWPYLDGALPEEWQVRVAAHLEECANCTSHFDFERAFLDAVRDSGGLSEEFAPLRARVVAALQAEGMRLP